MTSPSLPWSLVSPVTVTSFGAWHPGPGVSVTSSRRLAAAAGPGSAYPIGTTFHFLFRPSSTPQGAAADLEPARPARPGPARSSLSRVRTAAGPGVAAQARRLAGVTGGPSGARSEEEGGERAAQGGAGRRERRGPRPREGRREGGPRRRPGRAGRAPLRGGSRVGRRGAGASRRLG